ncbi:MAG: hypothetical protein ACTHWH_06045 [Marinobacter sp.]
MNAGSVALILSQMVSILNASVALAHNSQKYRDLVANAVREGRDLSQDELASLREDAQEAVNKL